jgi:hypothetical protein
MKIAFSCLFVLLAVGSVIPQFAGSLSNKDYKTFVLQAGLIAITLVSGILLIIFQIEFPSIAGLTMKLLHWMPGGFRYD